MRWRFNKDLLAVTIVLGAAAGELLMRELNYRLLAELPSLLMVAVAWLVCAAMITAMGRWASSRTCHAVSRIAVLATVAMWIEIVGGPAITMVAGRGLGSSLVLWMVYGGLLLAAVFVSRLPAGHWMSIRRALSVAGFLFVASQPVVASLRAPTLLWPDRTVTAMSATAADRRDITLFLLFDELNAKAAAPIADALLRAGGGVRVKQLVPIGTDTHVVIPSMFAHQRFDYAKPCGLATVCSGDHVLDFTKIVASRQDVDVVGFYQPYCEIRGLRYCARLSPSPPTFDGRRWWCAALRRSTWLASMAGEAATVRCSALGGEVWQDFVQRIEAAIWLAPVWQHGGFLYAHIPLPHPPGALPGGSLSSHYQANLERSVRLVEQMVKAIGSDPKRRFTIVAFSDHPLRQGLWCASTQYLHNGCPLEAGLVDDHVPLIVAGDVPAAFERIQNNGAIFQLAEEDLHGGEPPSRPNLH